MTPEEMAKIHARCFTSAPRPWSAAEFCDYVIHPDHIVVTRARGLAVARIASDQAELLTIAVDPAYQGKGTGRALLAEALASCAARGCARMFLEVADTNIAAISLYRSAGFEFAGARKDYYASSGKARISAQIMRCDTISDAQKKALTPEG